MLYFLLSTLVLTLYIDVVLSLSIWSKVNICNVNCARATSFIFDTRTDVLVNVSNFLTQKKSRSEGDSNPQLSIHAECSNHLNALTIYLKNIYTTRATVQNIGHSICLALIGPDICCVICYEHWLWRYRYFWSKVNIWNVNCARATALIFDTRTDVLVKVSNIMRQKMSRSDGDSNPQPSIHAECSNHLSYQGQTFAVPCVEHWLWRCRYFLSKVIISNVNCVRATAFIFDTRTNVLVKLSTFLRQKMSRPEGDSNPQHSDSCRMLLPFELSGPDIYCPMNRSSGSPRGMSRWKHISVLNTMYGCWKWW